MEGLVVTRFGRAAPNVSLIDGETELQLALQVENASSTNEVVMALAQFGRDYQPIHGYISAIICILGILFNIGNIYVLTRRNMRTSATNILLTALAVANLITEVIYLPFTVYFNILTSAQPEYGHSEGWIYYAVVTLNLVLASHAAAMWLTVTIATFRFIYVCKHTRAQTLCSVRRAYVAVVVVIFLSALINIPVFICYSATEVSFNDDVRSNVTSFWVGATDHCQKNEGSLKIITHLVFGGILKTGACVLLLFFTAMLIKSMREVCILNKIDCYCSTDKTTFAPNLTLELCSHLRFPSLLSSPKWQRQYKQLHSITA